MQIDPDHLATLAAILRRGSFELAAAELGITPSAVSQRMKQFEDRIGTALVSRSPPCTATQAGTRLAKHAEDVATLERHALNDLHPAPQTKPDQLTIAINADSVETWFIDVMAQCPETRFTLRLDDQDHSADWLRRGAVSAAITSEGKAPLGCDCAALGSLRYIAAASPAFVAHWFANGVTENALAAAPLLTFNAKDQLQHRWITRQTGKLLSPSTHALPSTDGFVRAMVQGVGWGLNPQTLVAGHIAAGRLIDLTPDAPTDVPLYLQSSRIMGPALSQVLRSIRTVARHKLHTNDTP